MPSKRRLATTIALCLSGLMALAAFILFLIDIGVTNDGIAKEKTLTAEYQAAQNVLSDCQVKIRETSNVATGQADSFNKAMTDAVKGRYEGKSPSSGAMFSAMVEDYPDLSGLNAAFERVHNVVTGCRSDFRDYQNKLLDELRAYETWRRGSLTTRVFAGGEFPSRDLVAQIGTDRSRKGQAALDQMFTIVTTKDTKKSYETGELEPEQPFATSTK